MPIHDRLQPYLRLLTMPNGTIGVAQHDLSHRLKRLFTQKNAIHNYLPSASSSTSRKPPVTIYGLYQAKYQYNICLYNI